MQNDMHSDIYKSIPKYSDVYKSMATFINNVYMAIFTSAWQHSVLINDI